MRTMYTLKNPEGKYLAEWSGFPLFVGSIEYAFLVDMGSIPLLIARLVEHDYRLPYTVITVAMSREEVKC